LLIALVHGTDSPAAAASGSLRIDPPAQTVAVGQAVTLKVIQSADVATLGAQTNLRFNPAIVQITSVQVGPSYTDALFLYGVEQDGTASSIEAAIAGANATGVLRNLATFFTPGSGSAPPGDTEFLSIALTGRSGGKTALELVPLDLSPVEMLDEEANPIPVTGHNGEITVTGGAAPPPVTTATVAAASATPAPTAMPEPEVRKVPANAAATLSIGSSGQRLSIGGEATVELQLKSNVKTIGAQTDIAFDRNIIEITKIETGPSWSRAKLSAGTSKQTMPQAIAEANTKGELKSVSVVLLQTGTGNAAGSNASPSATPNASASSTPAAPASAASSSSSASSKIPTPLAQASTAEQTVMVVTVKGLKNGETELKFKNAEVLDENGDPLKVTAQNGKLVVGEGGGGGMSMFLLVPIIFLIGAVAAGGAFAYRSFKNRDEI
jgi:hypothetical protein